VKVIRGQLRLTQCLPKSVVTIGNFDGFHVGHQQLLKILQTQARLARAPAVVLTFEPHPREFFNPQSAVPRLMRFREKYQFLSAEQFDYMVCLRFSSQLASLPAADFVTEILVKQLGAQAVIVGEDFRFGAGRLGNIKLLQKLGETHGFQTLPVSTLIVNGERVSSTRVRQAIQSGNLMLANQLLGREYFLCGKIVHGDARGREWGFPTANIQLAGKPVVASGIYVVQVRGLAKQPLPGVASVGVRPMFFIPQPLLEVHLLDFNRDIYGKNIKVEFLHKLRDEQIFANTDELIEQISMDVQQARHFLEENYDDSISKNDF
jgi:riboflavin kinase / FMN adenylyltransferase